MPGSGAVVTAAAHQFLREWHLATLTTLDPDGLPHVVPVGFTWDADVNEAWIIVPGQSRNAANVRERAWASLCQFEHNRWITLAGSVHLVCHRSRVAEAETRYAARYLRRPLPDSRRMVLVIRPERVLTSPALGEATDREAS